MFGSEFNQIQIVFIFKTQYTLIPQYMTTMDSVTHLPT